MSESVMIFDALDTVQGYKGAPAGASKAFYQDHLARQLGMSREKMLAEVPYEAQLWMTGMEIQKGNLEPVMVPGADEVIEIVKSHGITPVIVTADILYSAALTTKPLTERGLIDPNNVYGMNALGSKKKAETWQRVRETYFPNATIDGVFEDTEENLHAALDAYRVQGYLVKEADSGIAHVSPQVIRGNLKDLERELSRIINRLSPNSSKIYKVRREVSLK